MSDYGNPGTEYENTRHNVGFRVIDELAKILNIDMTKKKFDAIIGEGRIEKEKVILIKPQTFMNLSGKSVIQFMDYYKLFPEDLIVIYDDIDIELGKIRIRKSGSGGTHNGMKNIVNMIASEDFARIRVGTDKPKNMELVEYVLAPFTKEENEIIKESIYCAAKATIKIITSGIDASMNEFNGM